MKALAYILTAAAMFLASCMAQHTCPTYMKKDTNKTQNVRV
jgi:PBP1b-binding outer membrane lipoprotein LpoB